MSAVIVIAVGILYIIFNVPQDGEVYERIESLEVETPVVLEKWQTDEDAIKAAQAVIRKKELQAELEQLDAEIKERQAKKVEVEKELGTY